MILYLCTKTYVYVSSEIQMQCNKVWQNIDNQEYNLLIEAFMQKQIIFEFIIWDQGRLY